MVVLRQYRCPWLLDTRRLTCDERRYDRVSDDELAGLDRVMGGYSHLVPAGTFRVSVLVGFVFPCIMLCL